MSQIGLYRTPSGWVADYRDSARRGKILALFGTDQLPAAYTELAEPEMVRTAIIRLNPTEQVTLWNGKRWTL